MKTTKKKKEECVPHCTKCGTRLVKSEEPAEKYRRFNPMFLMATEGFEKYNECGERQYLIQYRCPNYGERRGVFFTKVEHDSYSKQIDGFEYSTKVVSLL